MRQGRRKDSEVKWEGGGVGKALKGTVNDTTTVRVTVRGVVDSALAQSHSLLDCEVLAVVVIQHAVRVRGTRAHREDVT
jgi:hypothetical protein